MCSIIVNSELENLISGLLSLKYKNYSYGISNGKYIVSVNGRLFKFTNITYMKQYVDKAIYDDINQNTNILKYKKFEYSIEDGIIMSTDIFRGINLEFNSIEEFETYVNGYYNICKITTLSEYVQYKNINNILKQFILPRRVLERDLNLCRYKTHEYYTSTKDSRIIYPDINIFIEHQNGTIIGFENEILYKHYIDNLY